MATHTRRPTASWKLWRMARRVGWLRPLTALGRAPGFCPHTNENDVALILGYIHFLKLPEKIVVEKKFDKMAEIYEEKC